MAKEKIKKEEKTEGNCTDKLCPFHGENKLKLRGRIFEGTVIKKLKGRVTIAFEHSFFIPKYERYEKRQTKIHARLPSCLDKEINVGDYIQIEECRTLSKIIHAVVTKKIRGATEKEEKLVEAAKEKEGKKKSIKEKSSEETA